MSWHEEIIQQVARSVPGGYAASDAPACEPTAWAAISLARAAPGQPLQSAQPRRAGDWLRDCQTREGSVGINQDEPDPAWPTSLSMLAWSLIDASRYAKAIEKATNWALRTKGKAVEQRPQIGHNTSLIGWSWAAETHSWLEPTALFVKALTMLGHARHARTTEAVRLMVDRLLPDGGANYGNTRVLDQFLRPHVQPTGIVLWALADHEADDKRIKRALEFLERSLQSPLGAASLAFAVMGLRAHGRNDATHDQLLEAAFEKQGERGSCYKLALLALASQEPLLA